MITKEEFENLDPESRGYAVYMCGARKDQPHVPDESNPYTEESEEWELWKLGQTKAIIEVQDVA